ncbi:MAG TPA: hypothetical protein VLA12_14905 [Planctomycetaceae bacterium]|nr:hypothetical protein [Planctomycetaceae bacterium]
MRAIAKKAGKEQRTILTTWCPACRKEVERGGEQYGLLCANGHQGKEKYTTEQKAMIEDSQLVCPKCKGVREFYLASRGSSCRHDPKSYAQRFAITEVVEFDTILLASRHLYRAPYSLHEKSSLVSVVIEPENILTFKKEDAKPDAVDLSLRFLDSSLAKPNEAASLVAKALERMESSAAKPVAQREFEPVGEMIAMEHFPPCMLKILDGLQDGKKRAMFALTNFLQMTGWPPEAIEKLLFEWNEKNPEPLREVVIRGHLRSHIGPGKLPILPPNCMQFYRELGICAPDDLCRTIKNPVMYAVKREKMGKSRVQRKSKTN